MNEAQAVAPGHGREIRVIAHDRHQVAREISRLPAQHQIVKAMIRLRNEDRHPRPIRRRQQADVHPQRLAREPGKLTLHRRPAAIGPALHRLGTRGPARRRLSEGGLPLDPLKEHAFLGVAVLVGMQDVATLRENPTGDARDEARLVGSVQQSDEGSGRLGHERTRR